MSETLCLLKTICKNDWPLAIIREVCPGRNGYMRVKLRTSKSELIRPIQRIISLEIGHSSPEVDNFIRSTTSETIKDLQILEL